MARGERLLPCEPAFLSLIFHGLSGGHEVMEARANTTYNVFVFNIGADIANDEVVVACSEQSFLTRPLANQRAALLALLKKLIINQAGVRELATKGRKRYASQFNQWANKEVFGKVQPMAAWCP